MKDCRWNEVTNKSSHNMNNKWNGAEKLNDKFFGEICIWIKNVNKMSIKWKVLIKLTLNERVPMKWGDKQKFSQHE
jgi:hypothetical protein